MVSYTEVIQDGHRADQYPEVGISPGNQALTECAFLCTNPQLALTSEQPVIQPQSPAMVKYRSLT
jgi:hypothetical protein